MDKYDKGATWKAKETDHFCIVICTATMVQEDRLRRIVVIDYTTCNSLFASYVEEFEEQFTHIPEEIMNKRREEQMSPRGGEDSRRKLFG